MAKRKITKKDIEGYLKVTEWIIQNNMVSKRTRDLFLAELSLILKKGKIKNETQKS